MRRRSRLLAFMLSVVVATGLVSLSAPAAVAEEMSEVTLEKTASAETVKPGETFSYDLDVSCTAIAVNGACTNATIVDKVPAEFEIVRVDAQDSLGKTKVTTEGNTITIVMQDTLSDPPGAIGMKPTTGTVTVLVRVPENYPYAKSGIPVTNTATITATNGVKPATDSATVTPIVTLALHAGATKTISPEGGPAAPGTPATASLIGTNTSNAGVTKLVLTDPINPAAQPNPFTLLGVTGLGNVTMPEGADLVQVDVWDGATWVAGTAQASAVLPAGVDVDDIAGFRFTFTNSAGGLIPQGASASVDIDLAQREAVSELGEQVFITNDLQVDVSLNGESASATDDATYRIPLTVVSAGAKKSIDPNGIVAGESSTVTTSVTNTSTDTVAKLTLTEPAITDQANPDASAIPAGITFDAFTNTVMWPAGATSATVTWTYRDGTTETVPAGDVDTLPAPDATREVARFSVTYEGQITSGAEARVPFTVQTARDITPNPFVWNNTVEGKAIAADGTSGKAQASDTLTVYDKHLALEVAKKISPASILAFPGQPVTVQLPAHLLPFPADAETPGSTTDAHTITVSDPKSFPVDPATDSWWNAFNATSVTQTAVPAGSKLTVQYWDGTKLVDLPGFVDIAGPTVFSKKIPAELRDTVKGLQFTFTSELGFAPGTKVQPNFGAELRAGQRSGGGAIGGPAGSPLNFIENCAASGATAPNIDPASAEVAAPCPTIELIPTLPGTGDLITKTWLEGAEATGKTVIARSGDTLPARINWSTGGYGNLDTVVISDTQDPADTPVKDTVFNAFDLTGVRAISASDDPWLKYDTVKRVELYNGTKWVTATNDPCPGRCDGAFPGVTFTADEQKSTIGVRLVFAESATRGTTIGNDPTAPQVGSGVARSIGNDRSFILDFAVRDQVRVPVTTPDPALGSREYNSPGHPGDVINTARATGFDAGGKQVVTDTDADTATIIDTPLNVQVKKTWDGGPVGIPPLNTPKDSYPSGRVTIVATNVTAAKVDSLSVAEPGTNDTGAAMSDPFKVFNLKKIESVSVPDGAISSTVEFVFADGTTRTEQLAAALGLVEADLVDVVGLTVTHTGRIASGATTTITLDTRLRQTVRGDDRAVTKADFPEVANTTKATVADLGGKADDTPTAFAGASIKLEDASISVKAFKSFNEKSQQEPNRAPVSMTIGGQPGGSVRTTKMVLTDDSGTFWNAYDAVGMAGQLKLTAPINRVQVDVCIDRSFDDVSLNCEASGGHWVLGSVQTAAQFNSKPIPDGVTAAQVEGVRYTFTRDSGAFWENPATPRQDVSISVKRRIELRSGGEVPSTLEGSTPAPGETKAGEFTNRVVADVTGAVNSGSNTPPLTATDNTTAVIGYTHSKNAVAVQKTPTGVQSPGKTFTYGLTVTNSGNTPIMNPVITDVLPRDAGGPQLIFDPTTDLASSSPYSYSITGAAPIVPNGTQLPTAVTEVTASVNASADRISFSFPKGSVLEVGQTYKVSVQLMFRPGLTANTQVTNSFGVTGDRAWDACTGVTGGRPGTLDKATGECRTDTIVTVQLAGAIRPVKTVKAVDPELGTKSITGPSICAADEDGFWRGGCVPVTKPGKDEIWRMAFTNTGTLGMNRMVAIDKLPAVGDTGSNTSLPRGSQFAPTFEGTVELAGAPAGSVLTTYYTTDALPCTADLDTTGAGCAPGKWTKWDQAGGIDPKTVLGLKFVVDFATPLAPAGMVTIDLTTTSPAVSPTPGADTVAWNTVAVAGRTVNGATIGKTPIAEGNKVGVILATGPLQVVKALEGDGAARYAPATYTGVVTCVSAGVTLPPVSITLNADGTPVAVTDLPWGAECTVSEDDHGQTEASANTVTIKTAREDVPVVTLTNTYSLAGLTISKAVTSTAVDADGTPISYGPFQVGVSCTFLDAPVYADGYSVDSPMDLTLADGDSITLTGLPARAACDITETDTKGAVSTSVATVVGGTDVAPVDGTTTSVVLGANDTDGDATNAADFTNVFADGSVEITKVVMGDGAEAYGAGPFTVHATCTLVDPTGTRTVWDGDLVLGGDEPLVQTIDHIASGATCEVTETRNGGADWTTVSPGPVSVGDGETAEVTVRNGFLLGALQVQKTVVGDGAELYGAGPFEVSLSCVRDVDGDTVVIDIPGGATRALTAENEYKAEYEGLPARALCHVSETVTGGATSSTVTVVDQPLPAGLAAADAEVPVEAEAQIAAIVDRAVARAADPVSGDAVDGVDLTVGIGAAVSIALENTFDVGAILVSKEITGAGAADNADKVFTVVLTCAADVDGETVDVVVPGGAERMLSKATGLTTRYEQLPIGADCSLAETNNGGAVRTTITPNTGDRHVGQVTVLPAPVEVPVDGGEVPGDGGEVAPAVAVDRDAAGDAAGDDVTAEPADVEFVDGAVLITVVNEFGPTPVPPHGGLTSTGVDAMFPWVLGGGLAALGALLAALALWLRRREAI